jgi:hypothetical protein
MKRGSWSLENAAGLSVSPRVGSRGRKRLDADARLGGCSRGLRVIDGVPRAVELQNIRGKVGAGNYGSVARRRFGMDITWVTDQIAVGGGIWHADNMAALSEAGITHIINMQIEFAHDTELAKPFGIMVCWNPVDDDFEFKPREVFERGVKFALAALKDPKAKLFIHCAAGVHRAPMMTLALLGVMGWTVEDAMDLIEKKRPVADFAEVYVRSVEEFLNGRS